MCNILSEEKEILTSFWKILTLYIMFSCIMLGQLL